MSRPLDLFVDPSSPLPLAAQLSQQLAWLIAGGVLREGDQLPAAQELAGELGINLHTVRAGYQQLEAQNLVSLRRGRRARVLAYDRTKRPEPRSKVPSYTIGVIIPTFTQFYAPLLTGIEAEAAQQPALVFVANTHEDSDTALLYLDRLLARDVDGIIVVSSWPARDTDTPTSGRPPIVFIDAPGSPGTSIEFDLENSQYLATSHLVEHGHRSIGYITPPLELTNVAPKQAGHARALEEARIEADGRLTVQVEDFTIASGYKAAHQLLRMADPPTAITATSDPLAVGIYQAARSLGVRMPNDLAVTSNDNSEFCTIVDPGLTSVSLPIDQAGRLAVQSIHKTRAGEPGPSRIVLDVDLIIRSSCGCNQI